MVKNYLNYFYCLLIIVLASSCDSKNEEIKTYFGGKIINPKTDYVLLYAFDEVIDTFKIDANGKFIGKLNNANEGLYYFQHGNENQHIYLEPEDSLLLRLNTWNFDESLVFAGKGAERNNILIDCFLEAESQNRLFYRYNSLNPNDFKFKVDSLLAMKFKTYDDYVLNHPKETEGFNEILKVSLTFPLYSRLETYPIIYAKESGTHEFPKLSDTYYKYREDIKMNKDSLMYFPPYSRYIRNYLYNETYALGHPPMKKTYTSDFTSDLLENINKNINSETTKNAFLRQTVVSHFYNKSTSDINKKPFETFLKLSSNEDDILQVNKLVSDATALKNNNKLPNFELSNYNGAVNNINDIIRGKNAFLFFWSKDYVSESYLVSRMNYLANTYPNITFVQVNIDGDSDERIEKLDIKSQYYLTKDSKAHVFLTSKMPRSILVNNKGTIINGYASISSYNVKPFLNQLNDK